MAKATREDWPQEWPGLSLGGKTLSKAKHLLVFILYQQQEMDTLTGTRSPARDKDDSVSSHLSPGRINTRARPPVLCVLRSLHLADLFSSVSRDQNRESVP